MLKPEEIPDDLVAVGTPPTTVPDDLVAVPEPDIPVYAQDRNQTIGTPQTFDSRELDYSMQTQLDGRDKSDFWGMAYLGGKNFLQGIVKGLTSFGVSLPASAGVLMKESGEVMGLPEGPQDMLFAPLYDVGGGKQVLREVANRTVLDEKMAIYGQKLIDWNKRFIDKLNLKPTAGQQFGFDLGSAAGSIATSIGLGYLTKNPAVMAAVFGSLQKASIYQEAREEGMKPLAASKLSSAGGSVEGVLEFIGMNVFFKAVKVDKLLNRTLIRIAEEAVQEGAQTAGEAVLLNTSGLRDENLIDIVKNIGYSMLLGAIASAPSATAGGIFEKNHLKKRLIEKGISEKLADRASDIIIAKMKKGVTEDPELDGELQSMIEKEVSQMSLTNEERDQNANEVIKFFQEITGPEEEVTASQTSSKVSKLSPINKQKFEQRFNAAIEKKLAEFQEKADEMVVAKVQLEEIKTISDELRGRIDVTKPANLGKEEVKRIPLAYKSRGAGVSVDEMRMELETRFGDQVANVSDLVDFLEYVYEKEKTLKAKIKQLQPSYVRQQETTILKEKIRALQQGFREGKVAGREETKAVQENVLGLLQESNLSPENKAKFLTALKNTQTMADLTRFIEDFDRRVSEMEMKAEVNELKESIISLLSGTKSKLRSGRPIGKFTPELQELFDTARKITKMGKQEAADKLIENLDKLQPGEVPTLEQAIENRLLQMIGGFDNKNLRELHEIEAELEKLVAIGKKGAELRLLQEKAQRKQLRESALKTIIGDKPPDPKAVLHPIKQWARHFINGLGKSFSGWDNLMDILSQDDKSSRAGASALSKAMSVAEVENNEKRGMRETTELITKDQHKAYGTTSEKALYGRLLDNEIKQDLGSFLRSDGVYAPLVLSKAEAIHLWMKFQDPTLLETLRAPEGNKFSPAMERALNNFLTTEDIADAKAQLAFYQEYYNAINEVYAKMYGVNLPQNEAYSPISREVDKEPADTFLDEMRFRRTVVPGATKTRVKNFHPIRIESAQHVLTRHIAEMNHFIHWADKTKELSAVFGNAEIRAVIEAKFGKDMLRIIDQQLQHFTQGGIDHAGIQDMMANAIRKNYSLSVLALKPKIGLLQTTGMFAFAADIPVSNFIAGIFDFIQHPKEAMTILAESEYMRDRRGGLDRDIKDILNSKFFKDLATVYNNPVTRALAKNQLSFKKALLWFNEAGDQFANYVGGWTAYKYAYDKSTQTDPELRKSEALKFFTSVASKTQQSGDLSQQSSWQRGGGVLRLLTMFQSAQNQYFREEVGAIRNLLKGRMGGKEVAKKIFIYHVLLPQLAQFLANLGRWDDEAQRDQLRALIWGSLNGIFVLNDILMTMSRMVMGDSKFSDDDIRIAPVSMIKGVKTAWQHLNHDEILLEDVLAASEELSSKTLGPALGLPIQQLFNYYDGVYDAVDGEYGKAVAKLAGWPPFIVDKKFDEGD